MIDAKHGDKNSVVIFTIGGLAPYKLSDRICQMATMFSSHHGESVFIANYGPSFLEATGLVETACAGFAVPG